MTKSAHSKVAVFLSRSIDACEKSQQEIANEVGFNRSNIISMLKQGITKLPVARVPAMAKAIGVDPTKLFRLTMEEYMPDLLKVCDEIYDADKLNAGEREMLDFVRMITSGKSFTLNAAARQHLEDFVKEVKTR
jgi:transcriptional regulator with XRE-family HTH domain